MGEAFYELIDAHDPIGELFHASDYVLSGWGPGMQNASAVSALLVRALERCEPRADARLNRVVIDLLGRVPSDGPLWTAARVERPGRRIELLTAQLLAPGPAGRPRPVATASAWRFAEFDTTVLAAEAGPGLAPLEQARRYVDDDPRITYLSSVDWRWLGDALYDVPGECWVRPVVDVVAGEVMTPLQRLFAVADIANGVGQGPALTGWTHMNTDLSVYVHRVPDGEWIGIRAHTDYGSDGVGRSTGTLFDSTGPIGGIQQSQLLRPRSALFDQP